MTAKGFDFEAEIKKASANDGSSKPPAPASDGSTTLATMSLETLLRESLTLENEATVQRQMAAISGFDAQVSEQLSMEHWAQESVFRLVDAIGIARVRSMSKNDLVQIEACQVLLPETKALFINVKHPLDPAVAMSLQYSAVKILMQRLMRQVRSGVPLAVSPAIQGARPALMSAGNSSALMLEG